MRLRLVLLVLLIACCFCKGIKLVYQSEEQKEDRFYLNVTLNDQPAQFIVAPGVYVNVTGPGMKQICSSCDYLRYKAHLNSVTSSTPGSVAQVLKNTKILKTVTKFIVILYGDHDTYKGFFSKS